MKSKSISQTTWTKKIRALIEHPQTQQIRISEAFVIASCRGDRPENQDRAVVAVDIEENRLVAVLCDGLGGMNDGSWCATTVASMFTSAILCSPQIDEDSVTAAIRDVDFTIYKKHSGQGGSTLTSLVLSGNGRAIIAHVGDSRAYLVDADRRLRLLTRDDTIAGLAADDTDPKDLISDNRLVQFIGFGNDLRPQVIDLETEGGRAVLLTTDGVHGAANGLLNSIVRHSSSLGQLADRLTSLSLWTGGRDNATLVAIKLPFHPNRSHAVQNVTELWTPGERVEIWETPPKRGSKKSAKRPSSASTPPFLAKSPASQQKKQSADELAPLIEIDDKDKSHRHPENGKLFNKEKPAATKQNENDDDVKVNR